MRTAISKSDYVKLTRKPIETYPLTNRKSVRSLCVLKLPRVPVKHTHSSKNRARANNLKSTLLRGLKFSAIPVKRCQILRLLSGRGRVGQGGLYECKTATPTKTSFENKTLFHLCYFTIIQLVQLLHKRQTIQEPIGLITVFDANLTGRQTGLK